MVGMIGLPFSYRYLRLTGMFHFCGEDTTMCGITVDSDLMNKHQTSVLWTRRPPVPNGCPTCLAAERNLFNRVPVVPPDVRADREEPSPSPRHTERIWDIPFPSIQPSERFPQVGSSPSALDYSFGRGEYRQGYLVGGRQTRDATNTPRRRGAYSEILDRAGVDMERIFSRPRTQETW